MIAEMGRSMLRPYGRLQGFMLTHGLTEMDCVGPLQELEGIHVDQDGGLGDFFCFAIGKSTG